MLILAYLAGALTFGLLMITVLMCIHRRPPPTLHRRRKNRDAPERNLFSELKEGVGELERERTGGIDYKWINLTGLEDK